MRRGLRWFRAHPWRGLLLALLMSFAVLNFLAYRHARAMTHFVVSGKRTGGPQGLSLLQKVGILFSGVQIPHPTSPSVPPEYGLAHTVHDFSGPRGKLEGWYIPHEQPRGVVLAPMRQLLLEIGLLAVVFILAGATAGWISSRRITRPG